MEIRHAASHLGALACLLLAIVLAGPYLLVEGHQHLLAEYYTAGPLGVVGVVFLSALGVVIFLSGERGRADPNLVAGIMLVTGIAIVGMTALWAFSVPDAVVSGFPMDYTWIEYHSMAGLVLSIVVAVTTGVYARSVTG